MSKLQKEIAEEVNNAMERAIALEQAGVMSRSEADPVADRILALIAEAMLREEVVEAAARGVVAKDPSNADKWKSLSPYMQDVMVSYTRIHASALLTAAGITGAGQEGGEGE